MRTLVKTRWFEIYHDNHQEQLFVNSGDTHMDTIFDTCDRTRVFFTYRGAYSEVVHPDASDDAYINLLHHPNWTWHHIPADTPSLVYVVSPHCRSLVFMKGKRNAAEEA